MWLATINEFEVRYTNVNYQNLILFYLDSRWLKQKNYNTKQSMVKWNLWKQYSKYTMKETKSSKYNFKITVFLIYCRIIKWKWLTEKDSMYVYITYKQLSHHWNPWHLVIPYIKITSIREYTSMHVSSL